MDNFNVAKDAWMPVLDKNGKFSYISPIDLFYGDYESFAGDEKENYVMMLFCEAVVHSCEGCQPADIIEWRELKGIIAEKAVKYLNDNIDLFWMRGEKPFLQDATLICNEDIDYESIRISEKTPSNNGAIINSNQLTKYTEWRDIVLDLIVHQTFSVVFGKSKATPSRWCMFSNSPNGNYNFYVTADNIVDSVWLNLVYGVKFGRPVWEAGLNSDVTAYCSKLIPLSVRVYISDDMNEMKYTKGLDYPEYISDNSHVYVTIEKYKNEDTVRPMGTPPNMRMWREFNSLLESDTKPIQLNDFKGKRFKGMDTVIIHGVGVTYKPNSGLFYTVSITTSYYEVKNPSKLNDAEYRKMYSLCVKQVNEVCSLFGDALSCVNTKKTKLITPHERTYIMSYFMKRLDEISFNLFDYTNVTDCENWNQSLMNVINDVHDYVGRKCGYLAQFKLSDSKYWHSLRNLLTTIQ